MPAAVSSTKVKSRVCVPSPKITMGRSGQASQHEFRNYFAAVALVVAARPVGIEGPQQRLSDIDTSARRRVCKHSPASLDAP